MADDTQPRAAISFTEFDDALCWLDQAQGIVSLIAEIVVSDDLREAACGAIQLVGFARKAFCDLQSRAPGASA